MNMLPAVKIAIYTSDLWVAEPLAEMMQRWMQAK
jgi:hypothetical protein